jgi:Holliday junction resolvase RusA-like endonuclease
VSATKAKPPALIQAFAGCTPVPMTRPRVTSRGVYTEKRTEEGKRVQALLLAPHGPRSPLAGPLLLDLTYILPRRKQKPQAPGSHHESRPDLDNLVKLTMDVLTRLQWWEDDSQVSSLSARKVYGDVPGVWVVLSGAP